MRKAPRQTSPREPAPASALNATLPVGLVPWLLGGLIQALSLWRLVGLDHLLVWHDEVFTLTRVLGRSALTVNQSLFNATPLSPTDALVAVSPSGVSTGEILSLAHHLAPHVRIWGKPEIDAPLTIPDDFTGYFALTPSAKLRAALKPLSLRPVPGHWQWFQAQPDTMPSDIRNPTPEHPRRASS